MQYITCYKCNILLINQRVIVTPQPLHAVIILNTKATENLLFFFFLVNFLLGLYLEFRAANLESLYADGKRAVSTVQLGIDLQ